MTEMTLPEITDLLDRSRIGRLAMADADGKPYILPIPFFWDGHSLYVRLPLTGRKGEILSQNPQVCFEVDSFTDTLDDYASVLVHGQLLPVHDLSEKARIKALNDEKYTRLRNNHRPGHGRPTSIETLPLQRIAVTSVTGRRKESPTQNHTPSASGRGQDEGMRYDQVLSLTTSN